MEVAVIYAEINNIFHFSQSEQSKKYNLKNNKKVNIRGSVLNDCLSIYNAGSVTVHNNTLSRKVYANLSLLTKNAFLLYNEGRINVLLWYCLVGAYVGLPLGVVGSPGGKWLCVVRGRWSPPS